MNTKKIVQVTLVGALAGALMGCDGAPEEPDAPAKPAAQLTAKAKKGYDHAKHDAIDPMAYEHSHLPTSSPFILKVHEMDEVQQPGRLRLAANIEIPRDFEAPTTIEVKLPEGVRLVDGQQTESLPHLEEGMLERVYTFELDQPLDYDQPIRIAVNSRDEHGRFGASAERTWPRQIAHSQVNTKVLRQAPVRKPVIGMPARRTIESVQAKPRVPHSD